MSTTREKTCGTCDNKEFTDLKKCGKCGNDFESELEKMVNLTINYKGEQEKMLKSDFSMESIDNLINSLIEIKRYLYGIKNNKVVNHQGDVMIEGNFEISYRVKKKLNNSIVTKNFGFTSEDDDLSRLGNVLEFIVTLCKKSEDLKMLKKILEN